MNGIHWMGFLILNEKTFAKFEISTKILSWHCQIDQVCCYQGLWDSEVLVKFCFRIEIGISLAVNLFEKINSEVGESMLNLKCVSLDHQVKFLYFKWSPIDRYVVYKYRKRSTRVRLKNFINSKFQKNSFFLKVYPESKMSQNYFWKIKKFR